jgi:hypothetical protein
MKAFTKHPAAGSKKPMMTKNMDASLHKSKKVNLNRVIPEDDDFKDF